MRVPHNSVIAQVFNGVSFFENVEDLCWWESGGKCLAKSRIKVMARKFGNNVNALIVPLL